MHRRIHRSIIELAFKIQGSKKIQYLEEVLMHEQVSYEGAYYSQLEHFKSLFTYCKAEIPYYRNLFTKLKLDVKDFRFLEDLEKIPLLTKEIIRNNPGSFYPKKPYSKFVLNSTGGSTGVPMKFRISEKCNSMGWAVEYRAYMKAGYRLGEPIAIFGGASLIKTDVNLAGRIKHFILNDLSLSSYGMSEIDLFSFFDRLNRRKPTIIYGYASSIAFFADFLVSRNLSLDFEVKGVFTTSEMCTENWRRVICAGFKCRVFDDYGLNDSGVSAIEDTNGLRVINTERAILEVVNADGQSILDAQGMIIGTSLFNYDFPFIRYNTGDDGVVSAQYIKSGISNRLVLDKLSGRQTDYLILNNRTVGSPVLTVLMSKVEVLSYQFIQWGVDDLEVRLQYSKNSQQTPDEIVNYIQTSLKSHLGEFKLSINFNTEFVHFDKHRFIVRMIEF